MAKIVLLDASPLSYLAHHNPNDNMKACAEWAKEMRRKGVTILVPQGSDYEVRRGLIRMGSGESLAQLDALIQTFGYLSVSDAAWRHASDLWAKARILGIGPTGDHRLDFDTLLAAQAETLARAQSEEVWIATDNIGHLGALYRNSKLWDELEP